MITINIAIFYIYNDIYLFLCCTTYLFHYNYVLLCPINNNLYYMMKFFFKPKLWQELKTYNRSKLTSDVMAGIIVGIVALPLAIAFAIASGVSPEKGIVTAVIAGFIIAFFGGTKLQIGGPTGAFIVIVYGIVQKYGLDGLMIATMMAGVILILLGLFKLGTIIKFIPYPIIVGFTSGIAITIFSTQIADLFGLQFGGESLPGDFIQKWVMYFNHFDSINWINTAISIFSILIITITPRFSKRIPGSLIAIIVITGIVYLLKTYVGINSIDTIGDRFTISSKLPSIQFPNLSWENIGNLLPVGITIAILGSIESLLSATVADGVIGDKHNSNTELIAQGIANIVSPLFGGIPATGAIARTMTNINNGGKTPIAGIIHAVVLLLILLFLMPLAKYIPMACLAGVLVIVSYNMSEWRTFKQLLRGTKSDVSVLLITFFLTVIFDLTIAIEIGLLIACLLFMRRVAETTKISIYTDTIDPNTQTDMIVKDDQIKIKKGIEVYEIDGPYFFGIANRFEEMMIRQHHHPKVRIIRMRHVPFIDSTGLYNFTNFVKKCREEHIMTVLSGVNEKVHETLKNDGFYDIIDENNICENINEALKRAEEILSKQ